MTPLSERHTPAATRRSGRRAAPTALARDPGSLSLEFALVLPLVLLLALLVLHAAVLARDLLVVHAAAREGARVAATTSDDAAVRAVVGEVLGGRAAAVRVTPGRRPGELARVEVTLRSHAGTGRTTLTATAVTRAEPGIGRPGTPP